MYSVLVEIHKNTFGINGDFCSHATWFGCPHTFGHEVNLQPLSQENLCRFLLCLYQLILCCLNTVEARPSLHPHSGKITLTLSGADMNRHESEGKTSCG